MQHAIFKTKKHQPKSNKFKIMVFDYYDNFLWAKTMHRFHTIAKTIEVAEKKAAPEHKIKIYRGESLVMERNYDILTESTKWFAIEAARVIPPEEGRIFFSKEECDKAMEYEKRYNGGKIV